MQNSFPCLSDEQKENRVSVCFYLKDRLGADPNSTGKIVTGDKNCVCAYDLKIKI